MSEDLSSTLYFTPWSLDLFIRLSFQLHGKHTVLQPFRRIGLIVHISISVLPGTHIHLSGVPCPRTQHLNNVARLRGDEHDISLKILHQTGLETARQAATSAKRHALTIATCPYNYYAVGNTGGLIWWTSVL